jgi:P27 family predicted phage terminase small subunit
LSPATDTATVERYAALHQEHDELRDLIEQHGRLSRGSMGQEVSHPYIEQMRVIEDRLTKLESILGIGPLHRARLGIAVAVAGKESSKLDELLKRRQQA